MNTTRFTDGAMPETGATDASPTLTRAERLAQRRAERRAKRHARLQLPIKLVTAVVLAVVSRPERTATVGRRAERVAEQRARMHRQIRRTTAVIIAVGGGFVGITGAAAYFTTATAGSGSGSTTATTLQQPTGVAATASTDLLPGGNADLSVTLTNPNSFSIEITGISQGIGSIVGTPACTTTGVSVPTQALGAPVTVANGTHTVTIPSGVAMSTLSSNDCQGVAFNNIPVTLTVQTS